MERRRLLRAADRPGRPRPRSARHLAQPRALLRGRRRRRRPHRAFPALLPALRDAGLRHGLPDRRLLQARIGRHRAGQSRHLHRLQAVLLGLPLWRARIRLRRRHDEEVHALRRPHLQRDIRAGGPHPGLRPRLPDRRATLRRSRRPRQRGVALVEERDGFDLLPEIGFRPVNKYLPPRPRRDRAAEPVPQVSKAQVAEPAPSGSLADRFFAWADKTLSR